MGWYPDPADPARERYWDGATWTHNVKPAEGVSASAPLPTPQYPVAPQQQFPGVQQQYPYAQQSPHAQQYPYAQHPGAQPHPGVHPAAFARTPLTADGVPLAGWWARVGAHILDSIVVSVLATLIGWPYVRRIIAGYQLLLTDYIDAANAGLAVPTPADYDIINPMSGLQLVQLLVLFAYLVLSYGFLSGSPFQRILGMRIVPTEIGLSPKLGWRASVTRSLMFALVTAVPVLPLLSYLMPLWTTRRQALHDLVAGTQVVSRR